MLGMESSDWIALTAVLASFLAAVYAKWTWLEAQKANGIAKVDTLLALMQRYSELMQQGLDKSAAWSARPSMPASDGHTEACSRAYAEYQEKHREVSVQLEKLRPALADNEI